VVADPADEKADPSRRGSSSILYLYGSISHILVTTKIGTRSQGLTQEKKKKGDDRPGTMVLEPWSCRGSSVLVVFCELIRLPGQDVDFGPVT
jgi:hypothetical protein